MLRKGIENIKDPSGNKSDDILSLECAHAIFDICAAEGVLLDDSSVDLDIAGSTIRTILDSKISPEHKEEYLQNRAEVVAIILHSRYVNMYNLLKVRFYVYFASLSSQHVTSLNSCVVRFRITSLNSHTLPLSGIKSWWMSKPMTFSFRFSPRTYCNESRRMNLLSLSLSSEFALSVWDQTVVPRK